MAKKIEDIRTDTELIRQQTVPEQNTAQLVGGTLTAIVDKLAENESGDSETKDRIDNLKGDLKTTDDKLAAHIADKGSHVSAEDREHWNTVDTLDSDLEALQRNYADLSDVVSDHTHDTTVHVTAGDKETWNGHVENEDLHVTFEDKNRWNLGVNVVRFGSITYFTGKVLQLGYGGEYKAEDVFFDSQHNMFLLAPGSGGDVSSVTRAYGEWNDRRLFTAEFGDGAAPGAGRLYLCEADMRLYRFKAEGLEPVSTVNLTAKDIERIAKEIDIKSVSDEEIDGICSN